MNFNRSPKVRWAAGTLLVLALAAGMVSKVMAAPGPIGTTAGFEDDDGNLTPEAPINFDWNSFSPVTWNGTAPYQNASKTVNGWQFVGLTDATKSNDTSFAGGVKQDVDCASITNGSMPNKDDLKRIYVAHKTVNNHIFLELAWERIPQNSTTASAHVGFEFNQATSGACPVGSDGLVHRTAGDLLFVYDFTGGSAGVATLTFRRWVTSGACEVNSDTPPCWGPATDLTAGGFAEAAVDDGAANFPFPVSDSVAIGSDSLTSADSLGQSEFGEAGVDLTAANIFTSTQCLSLGKVYAVSRSSGNSGQAAMEDLVGPGDIRISNCGNLVVKKVTIPSPDSTNTAFPFEVNGPNPPNSGGSSQATKLPSDFSLHNGESNTSTLFAGTTYSASETVPTGWALKSATCVDGSGNPTGTLSGSMISGISVVSDQTTTCTFTDQVLGEIKIIKATDPAGSSTTFSYSTTGGLTPSTFNLTGQAGSNAQDYTNVSPGSYTVNETVASGWRLETLSCTASGTGTSGSQDTTTRTQADITLAPGGLVTCTYTNQQLGEVKIIKATDPAGSATSFSYSTTGGLTPSTFSLTGQAGSNTQDYMNVVPGSYTVKETVASGWRLVSLTCTTGGVQDATTATQADITLPAGGSVTCTYTNQQLGEIKIIKHTDPRGVDQVFNYTSNLAGATLTCTQLTPATPTSFSLNDSGNTTGDNSANTQDCTNVPAGSYTVTELPPPSNFTLESLVCTTGGVQDPTTPAQADIILTPGGSVTCTYTNQQLSEIKIIKTTDPAGSSTIFNYTTTGVPLPLSPGTFSLTGQTGSNTQDYTNVHPGVYSVNETIPSGWRLIGLSCTASGSGTSASQDTTTSTQADITLGPGGVVTCTYTNQQLSEIKIIKTTDPAGSSTSFSYSTTGGLSPITFSLTGQTGGNTQDYTNVIPGSYTVNETVPSGWQFMGLSCTASGTGSSGAQDTTTNTQADITLGSGGLVTCTYTNQQLSEVKIIKHTDPRGLNATFSYTSNLAGATLTCTQPTATSFSLNDFGNASADNAANTQDCTNVPAGSYTVTESSLPSNFTLESLVCTAGGTQDATTPAKAYIVLPAGGSVTCTYTNVGAGAIQVTKISSKGTPLAGATFTYTGSDNVPHNFPSATDSSGRACVSGLALGTYTVAESSAPSGYTKDPNSQSVTITTAGDCTSGFTVPLNSFVNTPLTDLTITVSSEAAGGTQSTVACVQGPASSTANVGNSPQGPSGTANVVANGLTPATYTCTVVVDP